MFSRWSEVRPGERRVTLLAFLTLFSIMAGHGLLETARDALFLARIAPTHLPFVYIGVAALAWGISRFEPMLRPTDCAAILARTLVVASLVTVGFWLTLDALGDRGLYALYLWSAMVASLAVAGFWLTLSERVTVTQAKRLFAVVGTGAVLGATFGTALAGLLALMLPVRAMLLAAAALFGLATVGPVMLSRTTARLTSARDRSEASPKTRELLGNPYVTRIALVALLASVTFTLVDYVFKSQVATSVASAELGGFFARTYFVLNILSLFAQLILVRRVVRGAGVTTALLVLPVLLALGGLMLAAFAGLFVALALKGADGSLRHSLHRTSSELLYVPMADRSRTQVKTGIDVVVQRAGQAGGSLFILLVVALGGGDAVLGVTIAVLAACWVALAVDLRRHYLDLFRQTLQRSAAQHRVSLPALDLSSLETVIATLNSQNDLEVQAALEYLENEGRTRLVPALVLYHPSPEVVLHALGLFTRSDRRDFLPLARRLLVHPTAKVRAAALRAISSIEPDEVELRAHLDSPCATLSATALVGLATQGLLDAAETQRRLKKLENAVEADALIALCEAIAAHPSPLFTTTLAALGGHENFDVRRAALTAMASAPSPVYLDILMQFLTLRELRPVARTTLVAIGEPALTFLARCLTDPQCPVAVRRHLPRTIMRFDPDRAATLLLEQMLREEDGVVRYKILRALGRLQKNDPGLELDAEKLQTLISRTVSRMYELLDFRVRLERGAHGHAVRQTDAHQLLVQMLQDKLKNGIERLFRLLGLTHRGEDLATMYRGLRSQNPTVRSSTRELLDGLLASPLREAVLGLLDEGDSLLGAAGPYYSTRSMSYAGLLAELMATTSHSLRSLAAYHAAELGLLELYPTVEAAAQLDSSPVSRRLTEQALDLLARGIEPRPVGG